MQRSGDRHDNWRDRYVGLSRALFEGGVFGVLAPLGLVQAGSYDCLSGVRFGGFVAFSASSGIWWRGRIWDEEAEVEHLCTDPLYGIGGDVEVCKFCGPRAVRASDGSRLRLARENPL